MGSEIVLSLPLLTIGLFCVIAIIVDAANEGNKTLGFITAISGVVLTGLFSTFSAYLSLKEFAVIEPDQELISANMITLGGISFYFDILLCIGALFTIIVARPYLRAEKTELNEFYSLVLYALAGMMIIVHSNHLLTLFLGIELMSLTFYIMAGYFRYSSESVESSIKYFLLGSFASGFLIYGMAMLYGATGTMFFEGISNSVANALADPNYLILGVALILIGLFFKASAFPFHQWAPDVYTGSPTIVASFMSTAGKASAIAALIIVMKVVLPQYADSETLAEVINYEKVQIAIAVIAGITMLLGNITAMVQQNVKRMLAYSSVAHAGYMLIGLVANNDEAWTAMIFYASVYLFMQIGAFFVLAILERETNKNLDFKDYIGLSKSNPFLAAIMAIFMFSLAGIPPMAGFFGKYFLFKAAIDAGFIWLTIIAVIASMISVYFYIGLVVNMYFREDDGESKLSAIASAGGTKILIGVSAAIVFLLGLFPSVLKNLIEIMM